MSINDLPPDPNATPNPQPEPRPEPRGRSHRVTCEGCECTLIAETGEIVGLGNKFKANRKLQDRIDELEDQIRILTKERDDARALTAPKTPSRFLKSFGQQ